MKDLTQLSTAPATVKGAERLASGIEELIATQRLAPGTRIGTKQELSVSSGMALPSVNEALRLLESRGRITIRSGPRGGVFVSEPSPLVRLGQAVVEVRGNPRALTDAIELRDALEPLIAADAAASRSDVDVSELRNVIDVMESAINDEQSYGEANMRLHARIALSCSNVILRAVYSVVVDFIVKHVDGVRVQARLDYRKKRQKLHADLVEAIANGDPELAARIARKHAHKTERL